MKKNLLDFVNEDHFVFCHNTSGLTGLQTMVFIYILDSLPIVHSLVISLVMEKIKYIEHHWVISVDLKMVSFLLTKTILLNVPLINFYSTAG